MTKMNPVVHFEMPAEDMTRMKAFYENAFGWKMEQLGEDMGNYAMAQTTETDERGFPVERGSINGGFFPKVEDAATNFPSIVISVDDLHAAIARVKEAGGTVLNEPMDIPGIGAFASFIDTEGNRASMLQPLPM